MPEPGGFSLKNIARVFETPLRHVTDKASGIADIFNNMSHQTYDNGLKADFRDTKGETIKMTIVVNSGAFQDPPGKSGLAHMVEHMSFIGDGSLRDTLQEFERRGGTEHAVTTPTETTYNFTIPKSGDNDKFLYRMASRIVIGNEFSPEQLQEEKEVVINENQMLADERVANMTMAVGRCAFGQAEESRELGGSAESVAGLTVADLQEFRRKNYVPGNMHIIVTGVSAYYGYGGIKEHFGSIPWAEAPPPPEMRDEYQGGYRHIDDGAKLKQAYVASAFPIVAHKKSYVNEVLKNYLTLDVMNRLRGERDRKVYTVLTSIQGHRGTGVVAFDANTRPENAAAILPAISGAVNDLAAGRIDHRRFETAVAQIRSELAATNETITTSPDTMINSFDAWRYYRTAKSDLKNVTPEDISEVARDVLLARPPTLVTRGDVRNVQPYNQFVSMLAGSPAALQQAPVPAVS